VKHLASPRFWHHYRSLPESVRRLADKNFELLKRILITPSLHFKKIGQLWSVRVGVHYLALALDLRQFYCLVLDRLPRGLRQACLTYAWWNTDCSSKREGNSRTYEEVKMGLPNRDELEGKFDQAKGKTKEVVGRAIDDRDLEAEGDADRAGGNVKEGFGKARRKVGEAVEDIGNAIGH
jgi:uncharacterized protein YjbJ (UPF0337 family)